jgi:NADPH:quinone reductase-like Zn-dependent oxidoreductase
LTAAFCREHAVAGPHHAVPGLVHRGRADDHPAGQASQAHPARAELAQELEPPFVAGVEGVARLSDGSRRYFLALRAPFGSLAELVPLAGAETAAVPADLNSASPAALGTSGVAAWLSLTSTGHLKSGENVLVLGAGGQVGGVAIQVARLLGASRVVGVVRGEVGRRRDHVDVERVAFADTASAWKRLTVGGNASKLVITPQR